MAGKHFIGVANERRGEGSRKVIDIAMARGRKAIGSPERSKAEKKKHCPAEETPGPRQGQDGSLLDRFYDARLKLHFMNTAISGLWGSEDTDFGNKIVLGCGLLMDDIEEDFEAIHKSLDPEAPGMNES